MGKCARRTWPNRLLRLDERSSTTHRAISIFSTLLVEFWSLFFKADAAGLEVLAILVKLPAILFDLALGVLVYAVARRFGSEKLALGAAALYVLNPAVVFVSALWGQVDSVACFFALLGVYALLRSDDFEPPQPANQWRKSARGVLSARATRWIVGGWIALALFPAYQAAGRRDVAADDCLRLRRSPGAGARASPRRESGSARQFSLRS